MKDQDTKKRLVAYYRVSTERQGRSGLGLEAQQKCVEAYAFQTGAKIIAAYTEVETGKIDQRPELDKAKAHARCGAVLVIAKLDRLYRDVHFLTGLLKSGVDVLFCDMPHIAPNATGRAMVHQMAVFAEWEAGVISERTKTALAAYKARGGKLGTHDPRCPSLTSQTMAKGRTKAAAKAKTAASTAYDHVLPQMLEWRSQGASLRQIAGLLNGGDHQTRTGCPWNYGQVKRVLDRAALARSLS